MTKDHRIRMLRVAMEALEKCMLPPAEQEKIAIELDACLDCLDPDCDGDVCKDDSNTPYDCLCGARHTALEPCETKYGPTEPQPWEYC